MTTIVNFQLNPKRVAETPNLFLAWILIHFQVDLPSWVKNYNNNKKLEKSPSCGCHFLQHSKPTDTLCLPLKQSSWYREEKKEDMDMWCSSQQFFTVKPLTATNLYQLPAVARQQWSQRSWFLSLPLSHGMTGMRPPYFLCSQFLWSLMPLPRHHQYEVVAFRGFTEKGCQMLCTYWCHFLC